MKNNKITTTTTIIIIPHNSNNDNNRYKTKTILLDRISYNILYYVIIGVL